MPPLTPKRPPHHQNASPNTPNTPKTIQSPAKVREGRDHIDVIVETSSLAGVSPPSPSYRHHLADIVAAGQLSNAQIEVVIYAQMRFNGPRLPTGCRAGFFLGDGAGVGKGRQVCVGLFLFALVFPWRAVQNKQTLKIPP